MLTPRLHGRSKRFFRGSLWPLENRCCKSGTTRKCATKKRVLQCWKQPQIAWCEVRWVRSMRNNFKVVVEKLVNTSRPMRRSVVVMKEHSCKLFWSFSCSAGRNFVKYLHKFHPSLGNIMSKYHAFAVPKHGYHHFLSTGGNPKFLQWRWVSALPLSRLPFGFKIEHRHPCLIHCDKWWKESTIYTLVTW